jgi:uncharacterized protein HemX
MNHPRVEYDGEQLHRALARALGVDRGAYAAVARQLTERGLSVTPQRYNDVRKRRSWRLETIELWLRQAGLDLVVRDGVLVLPEEGA